MYEAQPPPRDAGSLRARATPGFCFGTAAARTHARFVTGLAAFLRAVPSTADGRCMETAQQMEKPVNYGHLVSIK